jgi:hypothetical protein
MTWEIVFVPVMLCFLTAVAWAVLCREQGLFGDRLVRAVVSSSNPRDARKAFAFDAERAIAPWAFAVPEQPRSEDAHLVGGRT